MWSLVLITLTACTSNTSTPVAPSPTETAEKLETQKPAPTMPSPTTASSPNPMTTPIITTPQSNSKITSPLTISGTVPPGWMFEATAHVKLADDEGNNIAAGVITEKTPGTWMSGNPVEFTNTLPFQTSAKSGYLIIEADNPSGLPENNKQFIIPVKF